MRKLTNKIMIYKKLKNTREKLSKLYELAESDGDVLGINIDLGKIYDDLWNYIQKANELAEAVKERSDDDILLELAEDIKRTI